jgi:hypothetical protein
MEIIQFGDNFERETVSKSAPSAKLRQYQGQNVKKLAPEGFALHQPYFNFFRDLMNKCFFASVSIATTGHALKNKLAGISTNGLIS